MASDSAESPYTHQMTAGATRQLGTNYAASFDYVYMRGESFPVTRNVNARQVDGTFPILASGLRLLIYDRLPRRGPAEGVARRPAGWVVRSAAPGGGRGVASSSPIPRPC